MIEKLVDPSPKEYLEQEKDLCGGYTLKAILSAYNLADGKKPIELLPPIFKILKFTTPKMIQDTLKDYNFDAPSLRANKLSDDQKIETIKKELDENHPVILLIGNGHSKTSEFSKFRMSYVNHWISVWGYNDKDNEFYVFDSNIEPKSYDNVPIGNVKRTYEETLRDWEGTFYSKFKSFLYLPVRSGGFHN